MPKKESIWKDTELSWLKEHYETLGIRACAEHLKRSEISIQHKASRLNLHRNGPTRERRIYETSGGYLRMSEYNHVRPLHRWVMEQALGRKLLSKEIVHHIDGDRSNNDLSNLCLTTRQEHIVKYHPEHMKELWDYWKAYGRKHTDTSR